MKTISHRWIVGFLFGSLLFAACGPRQTELVRTVDWTLDDVRSWKGRTGDDLVAALGRPTTMEPDGEGGQIWVYETIKLRSDGSTAPWSANDPYAGSGPDRAPGTGSGAGSGPGTGPPLPIPASRLDEQAVEVKAQASFRIDAKGVIYRQWINPKLGEKRRRAFAPAL